MGKEFYVNIVKESNGDLKFDLGAVTAELSLLNAVSKDTLTIKNTSKKSGDKIGFERAVLYIGNSLCKEN